MYNTVKILRNNNQKYKLRNYIQYTVIRLKIRVPSFSINRDETILNFK